MATSPTLFEDFVQWNNTLSQSLTVISNLKADRYDPEKDGQRSTMILAEMLKDGLYDGNKHSESEVQGFASAWQRDHDEDDVKGMAEAGKSGYESKLKKLFTTQWSPFYNSTPKEVTEEVYSLLEHAKPKSDLSSLTGDIKKAAKLHKNMAGLGYKIGNYLNGRLHGSEAKDAEKEVTDKLNGYYDDKFLNTDERKATFGKMVEVLKKWAKKKPERAMRVYHQIYEKSKEEFQKLITLKNQKDYLTQAMESGELTRLYASANAIYEQTQGRKRLTDSSGLLPVLANAA